MIVKVIEQKIIELVQCESNDPMEIYSRFDINKDEIEDYDKFVKTKVLSAEIVEEGADTSMDKDRFLQKIKNTNFELFDIEHLQKMSKFIDEQIESKINKNKKEYRAPDKGYDII